MNSLTMIARLPMIAVGAVLLGTGVANHHWYLVPIGIVLIFVGATRGGT